MKLKQLFHFRWAFLGLALLAVGCQKESTGYIRIFAENMQSHDKVRMNPNNVLTGATWIEGEYINLNGTKCTIACQNNAFYLLDQVPLTETMYAIYPDSYGSLPTTSTTGTQPCVSVDASNHKITIESLNINFHDSDNNNVYESYDVDFPMAAVANANSTQLHFKHLTAGLIITLQNNNSTACTLNHVIVTARNNASFSHVSVADLGVTAEWTSGMDVGGWGSTGGITGDQPAKSCTMKFIMQTDGADNIIILGNGSSITFSVPFTLSSIKTLGIGLYDENNDPIANEVSITFEEEIGITVNHMYTLPTISFGSSSSK